MIYDISPPLDEDIAVWPGDTAFRATTNMSLESGDTVRLSDIRLSCHTGAHADAPAHVLSDGATIDRLPLEIFIGPCQLREVTPREGLVHSSAIEALGLIAPIDRLLLRTSTGRDRETFCEDFAALTPGAAEYLGDLGLVLLGLDSPSVDPFDSEELPVHKILYRCGIANLESLDLDGVPEGSYELIALPLRLVGRDASPVRAILRRLDREPDQHLKSG